MRSGTVLTCKSHLLNPHCKSRPGCLGPRLRCPYGPRDDNYGLESNRSPQCSSEPNGAVRKHTTNHGATEKQNWCRSPAVTFGVVLQAKFEQLRVREKIAVVGCQDNTGKARVLQCARSHCLACRLECDQCDRNADPGVEGS